MQTASDSGRSTDVAFHFSSIAYCIPIAARFLGENDFTPGPFNLGRFSLPVAVIAVLWMTFMGTVFLFPTSPRPAVADMNYTVVSAHHFWVIVFIMMTLLRLQGCLGRRPDTVSRVVLLPRVRRSTLVYWTRADSCQGHTGRFWQAIDLWLTRGEEGSYDRQTAGRINEAGA